MRHESLVAREVGAMPRLESAHLQSALETVIHETGVPGIAAAVSVAGERSCAHVGLASLESGTAFSASSRFEVSCLMKLFVSVLVHELVSEGRLDLDAPLGAHLDELRDSEVGGGVRVGHLLSHSSGYRGLDITEARTKWGCTWPVLMELLRSRPLSFPPGWAFNYEHSEHVILGEILARMYGRRGLRDLVQERLFTPLGVHPGRAADDRRDAQAYVAQHIYAPAAGRFVPCGMPALASFWGASLPDMTLTLVDLLRVGEWLLCDKASIVQGMQRGVIHLPRQVASSTSAEQLPCSFGHLCGQYRDGLVGHNGSVVGQTVALRFDVQREFVLAVGVNAWVPYARDRAIQLVHASQTGEINEPIGHPGDRAVFSLPELTNDIPPEELVGTYCGSFRSQVSVDREQGALRVLLGLAGSKQDAILVRPAAEGSFVLDSPQPVSCSFVRHPVDHTPVCLLGVHAYRKM